MNQKLQRHLEGITGGLAPERASAKRVRIKLAALMEVVGEAEREGLSITLGVGNAVIPLSGSIPYLKITVHL